MHSCIYEGTIRHRRFRPRPNMFQYRLFFMFLDLGELPTLFDHHAFWSYEGMNIKQGRQFGQIEKHEKQAILKHVRSRPESTVSYGPFVYAAMHGTFLKALTKVLTHLNPAGNTIFMEAITPVSTGIMGAIDPAYLRVAFSGR